MDDYIAKTVKAYDDTETFENGTRDLTPDREIDSFLKTLNPDALILDAGCAYGRDTSYILNKGYSVKSIDLSSALISRAQALYPAGNFTVKDVRDTGFQAGAFDGIWCHATLLHLKDEDIDKALAEFYRVLKPGGVLFVSLKKGTDAKQVIDTFSSKEKRFFNFKTKETFLPQLEHAGFEEIETYYINERERYGKDKRNLDWLYSFSRKK